MVHKKKHVKGAKWKSVPAMEWLAQHGYEADESWRGSVVRVKV